MDRRSFIAAAAAVVATPILKEAPRTQRVEVLQDDGSWKFMAGGLREVRKGQHFRMIHPDTVEQVMAGLTLTSINPNYWPFGLKPRNFVHGQIEGDALEDGHAVLDDDGYVCGGLEYISV